MDLKNKNKNFKCARYSWNFRDKNLNYRSFKKITKFLMSEEEAGIEFCGHRN